MASPPWAIVSGDFTPLGGMDRANYELARHLAQIGREVVLVSHHVWPDLAKMDRVRIELVSRPLGRHMLGRYALARRGMKIAREMKARGGIFLANGANCPSPEYNWLHIVHSAYAAPLHGSAARRARQRLIHHLDRRAERSILKRCKLVLCNSEKTRHDVMQCVGVEAANTRVIYLGSDPTSYPPIGRAERSAARVALNLKPDALCLCFVGQLQNSIKNFDTLYSAIAQLRANGHEMTLLAAGDDRGGVWKRKAERDGLQDAIRILGPRRDVPTLLAAADLLILSSRYDSYGLAAQEAIVRGLPVIVSTGAGVSERIDGEAAGLLLQDPESVDELARLVRRWMEAPRDWAARFEPVAQKIRTWTWTDMAAEIVRTVEASKGACAS